MKNSEKEHFVEIAVKAVKRAANKVAEKANLENRPLPIWKDGSIQYEVPNPVQENTSTS